MEPIYKFRKTRAHEYHSGIPARDLTEDDLKLMTDEQRATVEASKLYRKVEPEPERPSAPEPRRSMRGGEG